MKKWKKLFALMLAVMLALCTFTLSAAAEEEAEAFDITITKQPESQAIGLTETVTFKVTASGHDSYSWGIYNKDKTRWSTSKMQQYFNYSGMKTSTFTLTMVNELPEDVYVACSLFQSRNNEFMMTDYALLSIKKKPIINGVYRYVNVVTVGTPMIFWVDAENAECVLWTCEDVNGNDMNCSASLSGPKEEVLSLIVKDPSIERFYLTCIVRNKYGSVTSSKIQVPVASAVSHPFTDLSDSAWYTPYARFVYEHNIMTGMKPTIFGPTGKVSRAQFAVMLYRIEGSPKVTYDGKFPDVAGGTWYTDAVAWASKEGIITGYNNGKFGTSDNITREQIATILYRYAKRASYKTNSWSYDYTTDPSYLDCKSVSSFAKDAMKWSIATGVIGGKAAKPSGYVLEPQGVATRAECAAMLTRFLGITQYSYYGK